MEKLSSSGLSHIFMTVFLYCFSAFMVIPAITDITMSAICPGKDECSLDIYLTGFQHAVRASTDHIHTVLDGVKRYIVCLENKKCSCGQFQLDKLPCAHSLTLLRHMNKRPDNYCSPYYTTKSLLLTYELPVNPLPDEAKWDVPQHILVIPDYRNLMCNCNTF